MRNIFAAIILGLALMGASAVEAQTNRVAGRTTKTKVAVVEFTPGANATSMTAEAKRQLQASIAFALTETKKYDVVDVRRTRAASQTDLADINGTASTAAAVRVGKTLGVSYILTGTVTEYTPKAADGHGHGAISVRLIEVATGKVRYSGDISVRSGSPMRAGGHAEMHTHVMRHIIDQLAEIITGYI